MLRVKICLWLTVIGVFLFTASQTYAALPGQVNLRHDYDMFVFSTKTPELWAEFEKYYFHNYEIRLSEEERKKLPQEFIQVKKLTGVNRAIIQKFLETEVAPKIYQKASKTHISLKNGKVVFDTAIFQGRELNIPLSSQIIERALKEKVDEVELAVDLTQPILHIAPELRAIGIQDLISIGVSNFAGSSDDRIHNVTLAANHFNGHIIKKGETFSFVNILGVVDASTGYKKELVIKQDTTVPDFGGGICQVSSTLYRGIMLSGLPINERANHSYAVSYYTPFGSDATVYPGSHDLRFTNTTDGAVLIQTFIQAPKLYFVLLGQKPKIQSFSLFGPYITNPISAPPTKYLPSKILPPGQQLLITPAHNGLTSTWFREVNGSIEKYVSKYEARPKVYKVGGMQETQKTIDGG